MLGSSPAAVYISRPTAFNPASADDKRLCERSTPESELDAHSADSGSSGKGLLQASSLGQSSSSHSSSSSSSSLTRRSNRSPRPDSGFPVTPVKSVLASLEKPTTADTVVSPLNGTGLGQRQAIDELMENDPGGERRGGPVGSSKYPVNILNSGGDGVDLLSQRRDGGALNSTVERLGRHKGSISEGSISEGSISEAQESQTQLEEDSKSVAAPGCQNSIS